jgi:hypothetical protein
MVMMGTTYHIRRFASLEVVVRWLGKTTTKIELKVGDNARTTTTMTMMKILATRDIRPGSDDGDRYADLDDFIQSLLDDDDDGMKLVKRTRWRQRFSNSRIVTVVMASPLEVVVSRQDDDGDNWGGGQ